MFPGEGGFNRFRRGERRRFGLQCVQAIANLRLSHDPAYVQSSSHPHPGKAPIGAPLPINRRAIYSNRHSKASYLPPACGIAAFALHGRRVLRRG